MQYCISSTTYCNAKSNIVFNKRVNYTLYTLRSKYLVITNFIKKIGCLLTCLLPLWPPAIDVINTSRSPWSLTVVYGNNDKAWLSSNSTTAVFLLASSYIAFICVTSSRGCHEDATRKTVPWNLSFTADRVYV